MYICVYGVHCVVYIYICMYARFLHSITYLILVHSTASPLNNPIPHSLSTITTLTTLLLNHNHNRSFSKDTGTRGITDSLPTMVIALMVSSHLTLICPPVPSLSQAPPPLYSHFLRARTHIPPRTGSSTLTAEGSAVEWVGSKGSEEEGSDRCMRPL